MTYPPTPKTNCTLPGDQLFSGTDYKFMGGIQDWRWWKNYLYSDAEVSNLWTNKQTILPIPMGAVAFAGQFVILPESEDFGFDIEGFDATAILAD